MNKIINLHSWVADLYKEKVLKVPEGCAILSIDARDAEVLGISCEDDSSTGVILVGPKEDIWVLEDLVSQYKSIKEKIRLMIE